MVNAGDDHAATLPDCFAAASLGTGPDTVQAIIEIEGLGRLAVSAKTRRAIRALGYGMPRG